MTPITMARVGESLLHVSRGDDGSGDELHVAFFEWDEVQPGNTPAAEEQAAAEPRYALCYDLRRCELTDKTALRQAPVLLRLQAALLCKELAAPAPET